MRAVRIMRSGGPEVLELAEVEAPTPGPDELLIRVHAAALNRADILQALGRYPAPPGVPPDIPGLEYAGEVVAMGSRARRFAVGARVMGIVGGGAFAELLTVHEREAMAIPPALDFTQAAAIPEAFLTAYDALVLQGELRASDAVLIHAVASGVGTAAAQLASAYQANVIGTSRTLAKLDKVSALGVAHGLQVSDPPVFADRVKALTGGRGVDIVLDLVGAPYLPETLRALASRGRVLLVGTLAGNKAELSVSTLMTARARLIGTVLRSRPVEEKISLAQAFEHSVSPLFTSGRLRPVVDAVLPFSQVRAAFERISSNTTVGKLVLSWDRGGLP